MIQFRTEIVAVTDRDSVMLRAMLSALGDRAGLRWTPGDDSAPTIHFVDVDNAGGHRYWRGLDDVARRDRSIALAYTTPLLLDARSHWLAKPIRARPMQQLLADLLEATRPAIVMPIVAPEPPPASDAIAPTSLLQRIAAAHRKQA